ncbi:phenylalanine--tRNA ligase subunit beta [Anaerosalibacter bizertensis]|uniref:Phenylalanine--tRNA ligase beta subunit n=1 Tax=Anaerosalibacter bizertensis TaxID=932217 RepID=A0A844FIS5_9FIRM|nr:phenylalanine--tRNA ligase subunit beta [Anaerosalibacter bizertensis]MSS43826.1 phenylalanine--tRNA ligase subunit beta [Anaerosalibacter bizertensis]
MLLPMKWLKDYIDIDIDSKELSDKLTLTGSHVESIIPLDKGIKKVVVGKILSIEKHPNADKLVITTTDVGDEKLKIITGASNIKEGDYVPVALVGARLPGGIKIKKSKLRGEESFGMLCSLDELGINDNVVPKEQRDGIFILDKEYPLGMDIKDILGLNGDVIELEITPNRPDCLSIIGMARETCATFDKKIKYPEISIRKEEESINNYVKDVEILDKDLCNRYYAKVIKDVKIESSPLWLQTRLMEAGVRPINNIVDVTNYVMLEFGEPIHAFDLNKIKDEKIIVRRALDSEKITTIDGVERKLNPSNLVIADSEKPIAIAGIMGGLDSEVTSETKTILIETANFNDKNVRLTSKSLNLRTEASARFEKGIDPNLCEIACNRVCQLIEEIGAGKVVGEYIDDYIEKSIEKVITLRTDKVNRLLGTNIDKNDMIDILERLELKVEEKEECLEVTVPTFRLDLEAEVDLIEEIGRIYGFHNIKNEPLRGALIRGEKPYDKAIEDKAKLILEGLGMNEILTYSFVSPKAYDKIKLSEDSEKRKYIKIMNPLGEDYSVMRTTLIPNAMDVLARNYNYGVERAFIYEIGNIFIPKELPIKNLPIERKILSLGMYGDVDYFYIKGVVDTLLERLGILKCKYLREENHPSFHPGRTANIIYKDKVLGVIGEIHPDILENYHIKERVYISELDFDTIIEIANLERQYKPLAKYPAIIRDLAIVLDREILVKDIEEKILENGEGLIEKVDLFDVYMGKQIPEDKKSIAFSVTYRSSERTLKDEEVTKVHNNIINKLEETFKANLRS